MAWLLLAILLPASLGAGTVLLLSTGSSSLDTQTTAVVEGGGNSVILGGPYTAFTGTELAGVNAVMLLPNNNWSSGDMPLVGQAALVSFVNGGGRLVTSEWTNWKVGAGSFTTLSTILPVVASTQYTGGSAITYTTVTPDAVISAGVPSSFTFTGDNFAGVESFFSPKLGATIYYSSSGGAGGAGLVGWQVGSGQVMQFSTVMGSNELADPNYALLVQNSLQIAAVPESATLLLLLLGLGSLLICRSHRSRGRTG